MVLTLTVAPHFAFDVGCSNAHLVQNSVLALKLYGNLFEPHQERIPELLLVV
jgi:hypothetical protein